MSNDTEADPPLMEALDGLFAYDTGCVCSGIHDEDLRERSLARVRVMSPPEIAALGGLLFGTEQRRAEGYTAEDVEEFNDWMRGQLT